MTESRPARATAAPVVLNQFVRDLASNALSGRALLERLADVSADLVHARGAFVLELKSQLFVVVAASGITRLLIGREFPSKSQPSLFNDVLQSRRTMSLDGASTDPRLDDGIRHVLDVHQIVVTPIIVEDTVSGLLVCVNAAHDGFIDSDIEQLEHLADHSALVMRSQRLVQRAELAAIDARHRAEDAASAARRNGVLARTARMLADSATRHSVYDGMARIVREELRATGFTVYEANPRLRTARLEHQWGSVGTLDQPAQLSGFWNSPLGRALDGGVPVFTADNSDAVALLPLEFESRLEGLLLIRYDGANAFADDEKLLLKDVATQVVLAFRNAVSMAELERRARRLTELARAQTQLTHVVGEDTLPQTIADAVRGVIPSAGCDIFTVTRDGLVRVLSTRDGISVPHRPAGALELELASLTLSTGTARLAVHTTNTAFWTRGTAELCAVVRFGNRSTGILRLISNQPDAFDLQDLDLLTILARQAGTAVETSRLFTLSDFQRQRAEGAAELARVALEARSLGDGATHLLQVLDRFVPSIGKAIGVARARDGQIEYVAASGTLDVLRGHRPSPAKGVIAIAPNGKPRELDSLRDIAPTALASTVPDEWGFVVPLIARDRTLGVLVVSSPRKAPLLQRDRVTLERLSTSLALALDALLLDEEERLSREREHLLATALTTIDHPIFILDRVGVRYANPAAAREYGWSQVELMDMRFEQLVVTVRPARSTPIDETSAEFNAGVSFTEQQHRRRDESEFPAAVTVSALTSQDGEQLGHVVSVRNVSADRHIAEQLRHTEKMVALGELVAGVAHEINNPLTGISAFAQLLLEDELIEDQRESVQLIKQEADRAKTVIGDLLLFARKTESVTEAFDLNELIEQTLRLRAYSLRNADIRVAIELDPTLPRLAGDPQKMQQVLLNVLTNAEFAMAGCAQRQLAVLTRREGGHLIMSATDSGRGMTADVRKRIFEPFFTTKPEGAGTGLGMSVSYGIVQAHGGTIDVQSELGQGTTVIISIPIMGAAAGISHSADVGPSLFAN